MRIDYLAQINLVLICENFFCKPQRIVRFYEYTPG